MDKLREECGVFGIYDIEDASTLTALGLHALQHRGQEGCGIVSFDGNNFHSEKRQGLVGDHFNKGDAIKKLPGNFAIGHNRYSTTGETSLRNIQPFFADLFGGGLSISHNGNLTNAISLREELVKEGAIFRTTSDTETIVQLIAKSKRKKTIDKIVVIIGGEDGSVASYVKEKKDYIGLVSDHDLRAFYELALQGDKSYLMWKLGVAPEKSFDNMLREMFSDSYYNFKEYLARNPDMANKFGALAIRISERLDKILQPVHAAMFIESNPSPVKYAASLLGICNPDVRLPLVQVKDHTKKKISEVLKVAKIL